MCWRSNRAAVRAVEEYARPSRTVKIPTVLMRDDRSGSPRTGRVSRARWHGAIVLRRQPPVRITPPGTRPRSRKLELATCTRRNRELRSSVGRDGRHRRQRPGLGRHAKSSAAAGRAGRGRWPLGDEERYSARAGRSTPPRPSLRTWPTSPWWTGGAVRGATPARADLVPRPNRGLLPPTLVTVFGKDGT
jgi:hypothetical protein